MSSETIQPLPEMSEVCNSDRSSTIIVMPLHRYQRMVREKEPDGVRTINGSVDISHKAGRLCQDVDSLQRALHADPPMSHPDEDYMVIEGVTCRSEIVWSESVSDGTFLQTLIKERTLDEVLDRVREAVQLKVQGEQIPRDQWEVDCNNEEIREIFDQIWCSSDMTLGQWWRIWVRIDAISRIPISISTPELQFNRERMKEEKELAV